MTPKEVKNILDKYYTNLLEGLQDSDAFSEVFCYREKNDPATVYYIPLTVIAEKGQQEKLQFSLMLAGNSHMLQLACRWDIDRVLLTKLNTALLQMLRSEGLTTINFSAPSLNVKEVRLELADKNKKYTTLQSATSSGFPPYNAVFNLKINNEQKDQVLHTLNGTDDHMRIVYVVNVPVTHTSTATLKGLLNKIKGLEDLESGNKSINEIFDQALEDGIFEINIYEANDAITTDKLRQIVFSKAIKALNEYAKNKNSFSTAARDIVIDEGQLEITASFETNNEVIIEPEANVADWFAGQRTTDFISGSPLMEEASLKSNVGQEKVILSTVETGSKANSVEAVTISAPADIQDTSVNFISISSGETKATIAPPAFAPVKISTAAAGKSLNVITSYTDGSAAFDTTINTDNGEAYTLKPSDIGLAEIIFDASLLEAEEADSCRVHISYTPKGSGTDDERTIYMKRGEWISKWYVCTKDKRLNGELKYDVKVTKKDGRTVKFSGTAEEPDIKFEIK